MTAIASIVENGKVWMGGDSAGVGGLSLSNRVDPKVFINGEFIFGYTSSFRMGQLLEHEFSPPELYENDNNNIMKYMVKRFIPSVKECLRNGGYQTNDKGEDKGGNFLVGYRGQLYEIQSDYQVARVRQNYHALGCGEDLILGSLYTTDDFEMEPEERITIALNAAMEFSAGVRDPFSILSI